MDVREVVYDVVDPDQLDRYRVRFVLAKPFVAEDLLRKVADALSVGGAS